MVLKRFYFIPAVIHVSRLNLLFFISCFSKENTSFIFHFTSFLPSFVIEMGSCMSSDSGDGYKRQRTGIFDPWGSGELASERPPWPLSRLSRHPSCLFRQRRRRQRRDFYHLQAHRPWFSWSQQLQGQSRQPKKVEQILSDRAWAQSVFRFSFVMYFYPFFSNKSIAYAFWIRLLTVCAS